MSADGDELKRRWFFKPVWEMTKDLVDACFPLHLAVADEACWR